MVAEAVGDDLTKRGFVVDKQDMEGGCFCGHSLATVF
jgi:hypothetical protein